MQKETKTPIRVDLPGENPNERLDKKRLFVTRLKRKVLKHVWVLRSFVLAGLLLALYAGFLIFAGIVRQTGIGYYTGLAKDFLFTPPDKILSHQGRTNILILGKGGEGHEAPDLTDTIMFASVDHTGASIDLISLPRDIWITDLRAKLNSVYYWGNKKKTGGGMVLAKASVEEIIGQPVHYGVVIDFSGFKKIIDVLDGIQVNVETSFTDTRYPIPGRENDLCGGDPEYKCRYETIHYEKGEQHMDGETALKFVRSRNADGEEGTDFARAKRQQKVISAIKQRVLSREIIFSPKRLLAFKKAVEESIETDLDASSLSILARRFLNARENVSSHVLSENLLTQPPYSPKYDNLYVFIPKDETWEKTHEWVKCIYQNKVCEQ